MRENSCTYNLFIGFCNGPKDMEGERNCCDNPKKARLLDVYCGRDNDSAQFSSGRRC